MKSLWLVVGLLIAFGADAQEQSSPYHFNWKRELIYASGAGLLCAGGLFTSHQVRPLTEAQIASLDPYVLPGFDRGATENWNPKMDLASDIMVYGTITLPALMMINKRARKDFLVVGFMYAETAMLTVGLTELTKGLAQRTRPYAYNPNVDLSEKTDRGARLSFFSGHTALSAALCFTTAKIFSDYSDNPTHEALVWTGAVIVPAVTGYLRYGSGHHFPSDIITGYVVGGAIGYLVPFFHKRKPIVKGLSIAPYSSGNDFGLYLSYRP